MKKVILSLAVIAALTLFSCKCDKEKTTKTETTEITKTNEKTIAAAKYQCPMDCEKGKTYDKEGSCPVCKMDLKKVDDNAGHGHEH